MENILSGQNYTGGMLPIEVAWHETHMREQAKTLEKDIHQHNNRKGEGNVSKKGKASSRGKD